MTSLSDRDKKLLSLLVPIVVLVVYWFLILSPQRAEVAKLDTKLTTAESGRDSAVANANQLSNSKTKYAADYATVVRLGKAIPSTLDMPSLLVQLDSAAKGTGIDFNSITVGTRTTAATATTTGTTTGTTPSTGSSGSSPAPVAAGGETAKSTPGKATEQANDASKTSDSANQAAGATTTGTAGAAGASSSSTGLDTVPLNFKFNGSYFDLADFFHRVKRFVRVANKDIRVRGRLMTIDGVSFKTASFPEVSAEVTATIYLSPKSEGTTAGGTSSGPTSTPAAATQSAAPAGATPTPAAATSSGGASQ